ncbi:iron-regulated protein A precursor [Flavobacterium amnicola]|uniref:Iron-regulated protein A n=1 Tax=Flavobacterium amnicola TaxID=2506422 RepID=A0A4Q1K040_9FLAO|nr:imelysin family protein [Flavobacterium amnicola]RXR17235.1 iron-regulated protein A precursor [Flavobacterium amnicola]
MRKILFIFSVITLILSCSSNDSDNNNIIGNNYDKTALLKDWADNIIIPSYTNYQTKVQVLVTDVNAFTSTPNETNLQTVRNSWFEAYKAYQYVSLFNVGKSATINFKECTNIYPINTTGIESNISSGTYDFTLLSQYDRQGFPAVDYLINGLDASDANIVGFYTSNPNATKYKQYLTALANRLKTNADLIVADWNGGYRSTFISNNGNSITGSVSKTINNFVQCYEKDIRYAKVGIPAGLFSSGTLYPEKVEGYYKNNISKELLNTALQASQDFFNGKHFNSTATGKSLKSYLNFVNAVRDNQKLSDIVNAQYTTIYNTNNNLNNSFTTQVNSDNTKMIESYQAIQKNVVYFKLDMMQALNITIDYVDNDGD